MLHARTARALSVALGVIPAIVSAFLSLNAFAQDGVQVGRYSTLSPTPPVAQVNPLDAVVRVTFPRAQVSTVGDAVNYLLLRSGYHLGAQQAEDVRSILALPLPEVHRQVGPYSVQTALGVLMGQSYALAVDHARREVDYQLAAAIKPAVDQEAVSMTRPLARTSGEQPAKADSTTPSTNLAAVSTSKATAAAQTTQQGAVNEPR